VHIFGEILEEKCSICCPLEDLLLKDLFLNSLELREQNLNITVADLILIYNNLVEN